MALPMVAIELIAELVKGGIIDRNKAKAAEVAVNTGIKTNPVLKNEMNAESPIQSRVVLGSSGAGIAGTFMAIAVLWDAIQRRDFSNLEMLGGSIAVVLAAGYSLYGRLANGLKPLFSRFSRK